MQEYMKANGTSRCKKHSLPAFTNSKFLLALLKPEHALLKGVRPGSVRAVSTVQPQARSNQTLRVRHRPQQGVQKRTTLSKMKRLRPKSHLICVMLLD
jgi:hypothetical protein